MNIFTLYLQISVGHAINFGNDAASVWCQDGSSRCMYISIDLFHQKYQPETHWHVCNVSLFDAVYTVAKLSNDSLNGILEQDPENVNSPALTFEICWSSYVANSVDGPAYHTLQIYVLNQQGIVFTNSLLQAGTDNLHSPASLA